VSLVLSGDGAVGPLSATEMGYLDGVTSAVQTQIDAKLNLAGGKILQIVRATDSTTRSTTSTTYVDASLSATITPQKSDSAVLLIATGYGSASGSANLVRLQITDSSNTAISGAQETTFGQNTANTERFGYALFAYATPATTSAVTYKLRFRTNTGCTAALNNADNTGQLFAIEVSA
jgi:hypothetical protein